MARGFRIDLSKLGARLPKSARKPLEIADAISYPEQFLEGISDRAANPIATRRLRGCTLATRAHLLGIADLPAIGDAHAMHLSVVLFRLRVERADGDAETCVRQHMPIEIRRLAPGSSLRALAHEEDPRIAVIDWAASARGLGMRLTWPDTADQFDWPEADEWPAVDAIEVRDGARHRRRLEQRRAEWAPATARLTDASSRGGWTDNRQEWTLDLAIDGRAVSTKERVPDLALAKLIGFRPGARKLGGLATSVETVVNEDAPLAVLVSPSGEVAVDWEATLNQPELRDTEPA